MSDSFPKSIELKKRSLHERIIVAKVLLESVLDDLPSIQPERKRGYVTYSRYCEELWGKSSICSLCGASWQIADEGDDNFCPNCGAELGSDTE